MQLNAIQDDFRLNALGDVERAESATYLFGYYLTDESGNYLTDESGNRLVGYISESASPQILHALPDDFQLNAE